MSSLRTILDPKALISVDLQTRIIILTMTKERGSAFVFVLPFFHPAPLDDDDDFFVFEGFFCRLLFNQKRV